MPLRNKWKLEVSHVANLAEGLGPHPPANPANPDSQPDRVREAANKRWKLKKHGVSRHTMGVCKVCTVLSWCQIGTQPASRITADVVEIKNHSWSPALKALPGLRDVLATQPAMWLSVDAQMACGNVFRMVRPKLVVLH